MTSTVEALEAEALRLSNQERARLVERLIASLDTDSDIEDAWAAEVERRNPEIEHAIGLLLEHPRLRSIWRFGRRRLFMRRFPYRVIDTLAGDQVRILAVAHSSRRPGYWQRRG